MRQTSNIASLQQNRSGGRETRPDLVVTTGPASAAGISGGISGVAGIPGTSSGAGASSGGAGWGLRTPGGTGASTGGAGCG